MKRLESINDAFTLIARLTIIIPVGFLRRPWMPIPFTRMPGRVGRWPRDKVGTMSSPECYSDKVNDVVWTLIGNLMESEL